MFTIRFGMRQGSPDPGARADLYRAAVDMCAWAESHGCLGAVFSQHHASDDGYLPSPVPVAAAVAARTEKMPITVGALLLAFYEPVKLAEDLAVVDLLSRGRVIYVVGIGYRDEEFEMFGVDRRRRASMVEERIRLLQQLWSGEPAVVDGRTVRVTPLPFTPGGPMLAYGGGSVAAARRAGRLGLLFLSESHDATLEEAYRAEGGPSAPGCYFPPPGIPLTVFVADDPERAWAEIGEYLLADALGLRRVERGPHRHGIGLLRRHRRRAGGRSRRLPDPHARRGPGPRGGRPPPRAPTARRRAPARPRLALPRGGGVDLTGAGPGRRNPFAAKRLIRRRSRPRRPAWRHGGRANSQPAAQAARRGRGRRRGWRPALRGW